MTKTLHQTPENVTEKANGEVATNEPRHLDINASVERNMRHAI